MVIQEKHYIYQFCNASLKWHGSLYEDTKLKAEKLIL